MELLRTPEDRFVDLPDFAYDPHYTEVDAGDGGRLRIAHVEVGVGPVVLLLHGEPSWSFLYRHMLPVLADAGLRAVAPDLVGFGRSDKPAQRTDYTYQRHVDWMTAWLEAVDLRDVTLVCQDWGGLIGLRLVAEQPQRFARVVAANTFLPTGDSHPGEAFLNWQRFSQETPQLPIGWLVSRSSQAATGVELDAAVVAAYDAPFPDETFKEGARQFPLLVPTSPDDPASAANRAAWLSLEKFDKPFLCAFSDKDPITSGADRVLSERIPGAKGQPHTTITGGGHFLQEDRGPELARVVAEFVQATP
ncbi:MAG TPA: haloalkane dehalogenase [Acidimicrobiales bacterium]|nr:haloalkane dehalogenase [Acidimicrobiales bacterium]